MAAHWLNQGARRLHLVDLNGALAGKPKNEPAIRDIVKAINGQIPIQLGGGIRDLDTIERYLDDGISYMIIGTAVIKIPGFLHDACYAFQGKSWLAWMLKKEKLPWMDGRKLQDTM